MSFQSKVCLGLIGLVVVEQFAGMMYLLKAYYHIIVIDVAPFDREQPRYCFIQCFAMKCKVIADVILCVTWK